MGPQQNISISKEKFLIIKTDYKYQHGKEQIGGALIFGILIDISYFTDLDR